MSLKIVNHILSIIQQIEEAEKLRKNSQDIFREFVTNKSHPLDLRFKIWSEYCDKIHYDDIISEDDVPLIGKWVDESWPCEYGQYAEYTWEDYLDYVASLSSTRNDIPTLNEFKGLLIKENFGSFSMSW